MTARSLLLLSLVTVAPAAMAGAPDRSPSTRPAPVQDGRTRELIEQLGAEEFQTREKASDELARLGPAALPALRDAQKHSDPEVRLRAEAIVRRIEGGRSPELTPFDLDPRGDHEAMLRGLEAGRLAMREQVERMLKQDVDLRRQTDELLKEAERVRINARRQIEEMQREMQRGLRPEVARPLPDLPPLLPPPDLRQFERAMPPDLRRMIDEHDRQMRDLMLQNQRQLEDLMRQLREPAREPGAAQ